MLMRTNSIQSLEKGQEGGKGHDRGRGHGNQFPQPFRVLFLQQLFFATQRQGGKAIRADFLSGPVVAFIVGGRRFPWGGGAEQGLGRILEHGRQSDGGRWGGPGLWTLTARGRTGHTMPPRIFLMGLQYEKLRVLKTVLGTAGIFPASRYCISPHPEEMTENAPEERRKKSHAFGTAGRQGIKMF